MEYCNPDVLLSREQYYLDLLQAQLNVAGSSFGYKHIAETIEKFKTRKFSDDTLTNLAKAATGRILSKETRVKISMARKGIKLSDQTRTKLSAIGTMRSGISVEVINIISGEIMLYPTLTLAALVMGVSRTAVKKVMDCPKVLKKLMLLS